MQRTDTRWVALGIAAMSLQPLWAGPPLICHSYHIGDRPSLELTAGPPEAPASFAARVIELLDAESETLVRMETLRRAAVRNLGVDSGSLGEALLAALAARRDAAATAAAQPNAPPELAIAARLAAYDHAFARQTLCHHEHADSTAAAHLCELVAIAASIDDDPAVWIGVARAATPLMRSSDAPQHAFAFVRALHLTRALTDGGERERLEATLDWDLEHLEAYLLDREIREAGGTPGAPGREAKLVEHATIFVQSLWNRAPSLP